MKVYRKESFGHFDHGWLNTYHHFSFGDYYNPQRMHFGPLRVVNDDIIHAHEGFPKHPHQDMEIITYVIDGALTHGDSMGHEETVTRGQVQYMSAGTGVYHSEYNHGHEAVHLLQIWVLPDQKGHRPQYGDYRFEWADREDHWLRLVGEEGPIRIHQDVNFYVTYITHGEMALTVDQNRQAYVIQVEGESQIDDVTLNTGDALEVEYGDYVFKGTGSHLLVIEMRKE